MGASTHSRTGSLYTSGSGESVRVSTVLSKAGEGTIYTIDGEENSVAKIFHADLRGLHAKLEKVAAMVAAPPDGAYQRDGYPILTWPTDLLRLDDTPVGYLMPRVDTATAVEIHCLSNPFNRLNPLARGPAWPQRVTWSHLLTVAANLCIAVDAAHRAGAVVGDLQERNILVTDTCRVTLVDCDSMQFVDSTGRVHPCGVGRPEFSAPELLQHDLATHVRTANSDLFALAVHIHLLLMAGNHPFLRGTWLGSGDQPGPIELAKAGDWAGGPDSRLKTHPLAPPIGFLPNGIKDLFARAFARDSGEENSRPTAEEWHTALSGVTVVDCSRKTHQVPDDATTCPWCGVEDERVLRRATGRRHVEPASERSDRSSAVTAPSTTRTTRAADNTSVSTGAGRKARPPFKSTDYRKPEKAPAVWPPPGVTWPPPSTSGDQKAAKPAVGSSRARSARPAQHSSDEIGRSILRLFLIFAVPAAVVIVATVVWVAVRTIECVNGVGC